MTKEVTEIDFYKRRSTSISDIDHLSICKESQNGQDYQILLNGVKKKTIPEKDFQHIVHCLLDDFKDAYQEKFLAFDYELTPSNYPMKFYLRISFDGNTYLGLKGIRPFQQTHYQDIVSLFQPMMEEK